MPIRAARAADRERLYDICLRTGDAGRDATARHGDPELLGHVYVGPYLALQPDLAFVEVDEDDEPIGYVLGALDVRAFATACEADWWPPLRQRHPLGSGPTAADEAMVRLIHRPPPSLPVADRYPSELHIDLLPAAQGRGVGRRLVATLLDALDAAGSSGVHLGVDPGNTGAIAFYERLGFERLQSGDGVVFARALGGN